jgi:hypothetical protein
LPLLRKAEAEQVGAESPSIGVSGDASVCRYLHRDRHDQTYKLRWRHYISRHDEDGNAGSPHPRYDSEAEEMTFIELRDEACKIIGPKFSVCVQVEAWKHAVTGTESLTYSVHLLRPGHIGQYIKANSPEILLATLKEQHPDNYKPIDIDITPPITTSMEKQS